MTAIIITIALVICILALPSSKKPQNLDEDVVYELRAGKWVKVYKEIR